MAVYWKTNEWAALFAHMENSLGVKPGELTSRLFSITGLMAAQEMVLPRDRQRDEGSIRSSKTRNAYMVKYMEVRDLVITIRMDKLAAQQRKAKTDDTVDLIVAALMSKLGDIVRAAVRDEVQALLGGPQAPDAGPQATPGAPPDATPKPPRARVDVIGLLPDQGNRVIKEFEGVLDVRVWPASQALHMEVFAPYTFMTNFVDHASIAKVKSKGVVPVHVGRGTTSLIKAIREKCLQ